MSLATQHVSIVLSLLLFFFHLVSCGKSCRCSYWTILIWQTSEGGLKHNRVNFSFFNWSWRVSDTLDLSTAVPYRSDWQEWAITHHIQWSDILRNTPWNEKERKVDLESLVFVITDWYLLPFQPRTHRDGDILLYKNVVTPILHAPLWSDFMHFSADETHFLHIFYVSVILRCRTCILDILCVERKSD